MFTRIPFEEFRERTGIPQRRHIEQPRYIVSLRDIKNKNVSSIEMMSMDYLKRILDTVRLEGDSNTFPYRNCRFSVGIFGPAAVKRSQTFVEREKLLGLVENLGTLITNYSGVKGFAQLPPSIINGTTDDGEFVEAHYLPAIIERHYELGDVLVDGTHRTRLTEAVGNGLMGIRIEKIVVPFPCEPIDPSEVQCVVEKPSREKRFRALNPSLFRSLSYAGVDG